jgi:hypothetical protein
LLIEFQHGFSRYQGDISLQANKQPSALAAIWVLVLAYINPDRSLPYLDRKTANVIRPLVKGPPAFKIESRVVPMARQYAVFDAAAIEWETHVRTAIVNRIIISIVRKERDGMARHLNSQAALFIHVGYRSGAYIFRVSTGHTSLQDKIHLFFP